MANRTKKARSEAARRAVNARWARLSAKERKAAVAPALEARAAMAETVERVGVGLAIATGRAVLFHRVKVKLSRKYRVWPVAGDDRSILLDPSEFTDRYKMVACYVPEGAAGRENLAP